MANRDGGREEVTHYREIEQLENRRAARLVAPGIAGGFAAHETAHFAHRSLETYREFDKERRFGRAVTGISDDDQAALVRQAIHMGATTKFNNIQVLKRSAALSSSKQHRSSEVLPNIRPRITSLFGCVLRVAALLKFELAERVAVSGFRDFRRVVVVLKLGYPTTLQMAATIYLRHSPCVPPCNRPLEALRDAAGAIFDLL